MKTSLLSLQSARHPVNQLLFFSNKFLVTVFLRNSSHWSQFVLEINLYQIEWYLSTSHLDSSKASVCSKARGKRRIKRNQRRSITKQMSLKIFPLLSRLTLSNHVCVYFLWKLNSICLIDDNPLDALLGVVFVCMCSKLTEKLLKMFNEAKNLFL